MHPQDLALVAAARTDVAALAPESRRSREVAAALLRAAGTALDTLARRVAAPAEPAAVPTEPLFEFHAEAGAPEGALYVNGSFVGHVAVTRL